MSSVETISEIVLTNDQRLNINFIMFISIINDPKFRIVVVD